MTVLIFILGALLGLLLGAFTCVRFVRQQVTGELGPRLARIESQLDAVQAELTLAVGARYAELTAHLSADPRRQLR